jgi:hypothetical protein
MSFYLSFFLFSNRVKDMLEKRRINQFFLSLKRLRGEPHEDYLDLDLTNSAAPAGH